MGAFGCRVDAGSLRWCRAWQASGSLWTPRVQGGLGGRSSVGFLCFPPSEWGLAGRERAAPPRPPLPGIASCFQGAFALFHGLCLSRLT